MDQAENIIHRYRAAGYQYDIPIHVASLLGILIHQYSGWYHECHQDIYQNMNIVEAV